MFRSIEFDVDGGLDDQLLQHVHLLCLGVSEVDRLLFVLVLEFEHVVAVYDDLD